MARPRASVPGPGQGACAGRLAQLARTRKADGCALARLTHGRDDIALSKQAPRNASREPLTVIKNTPPHCAYGSGNLKTGWNGLRNTPD
jgi:hypothetical protein